MSVTYDAGIATSYAAAVAGGYTGTKEQYYAEQAQFAINAQRVAQDRAAVEQTATTFSTVTAPKAIQDVTDEGDTQVQRVKDTGDEYLIDIDTRVETAVGDFKEDVTADLQNALVTDTATGAIASFSNGVDFPMKSVVVAMEPVQDLNGYDNPWPAGGGANQFDAVSWAALGANYRYYTVDSNEVITITEDDVGGIGGRLFDIAAGEQYSCLSTFAIAPRIFNSSSETVAQTSSGTFTAPSDGKIAVKFYASTYPTTGKFTLVKGSTVPSAWSPYSNICPISGRTGVTVTRTGVNVWDEEWEVGGYADATGNPWNTNTRIRSKATNYINVLPGVAYYNSCPSSINAYFYDANKGYLSPAAVSPNATFVTPSNAHYMRFATYGTTYNHDISINYPSTDTAYHPYSGTTLPVTFPTEAGTVYGGTVDVVRGVLTVDRTMVDLETLNWANAGAYYASTTALPNAKAPNSGGTKANAKAEKYIVATSNGVSGGSESGIGIRPNAMVYVTNTGSAPSGSLAYELATPITYQLDPQIITSLLGQNNVWSDADSVTAEYVIDLSKALDDVEDELSTVKQSVNNKVDKVPGKGLVAVDSTFTKTGDAADAKAAGDRFGTVEDDVNDLKVAFDDEIAYVKYDVLEIEEDPSGSAVVTGATKILENIEFKAGYTYTVTWSIGEAVSSNVYVYWKRTSDDTNFTSKFIAVGDTSASYTILITESFNGYLSANTQLGITVTATVTSDEPKTNAIDNLEADVALLASKTGLRVAYGYNLKAETGVETGAGAYYWQSGHPYLNTSGSYGTDYVYYIFPINKNSVYSLSVIPRWIILVDENGNKVSDSLSGKMVQSGNAVTLYVTIARGYQAQFAISEGYWANLADKKIPLIAPQEEDHHGNSLPMDTMYFSVGIPEKLYYNNILSIDSDRVSLIVASDNQDTHDQHGVSISASATTSNNVGVRIAQFDGDLNLIYSPYYTGINIKAMNLQNCSAIVIGDSTVGSWDTMTQQMLDKFAELGKTLTLMGTRGTAPNLHEGRGGWSAKAYCTEETHGDYSNPFLHNGDFDFGYYMTTQGYTVPDFVVIQLGINDVSNIGIGEFKSVSEQALMYEKQMIDSIRSYNQNIKILINPPTTPTTDQSKLSMYYETTVFRNMVIRYAMMLRRLATQYSNANVRCSNNNLILDSATEIRDNVHPTEAGFIKLGNEVVSQINCWQNA